MIPKMPVRKANTPETPARSMGIVSARLLKNVSPPRCPKATNTWNKMNRAVSAIAKLIDHLPRSVVGMKLIFMN